ncbi:uncharacterized protein METZ01_LOCUS394597, partial [marine metagenome]
MFCDHLNFHLTHLPGFLIGIYLLDGANQMQTLF